MGSWLVLVQTLRIVLSISVAVMLCAQNMMPDNSTATHTGASKVDFKRDIEPIFSSNCYSCHGPTMQMNGLRLDNHQSAFAGSYSGPVIKPGNSAESKLILMVTGATGKVMPPVGNLLTTEQIGLLRAWIDQGAEWPEEESPIKTTRELDPIRPKSTHWAFIPPSPPQVPNLRDRAWVRNPIDAFILSKLEAEGVGPSPEASRTELIRRVSLDLIGLPPTPQEVDQFLADESPKSYERLVDRLLSSTHYGEKWARHWLDLARYADSDGYQEDNVRPYAWRYRDWVIQALNDNMPFDQFTTEQMAGDLLPSASVEQKMATGFNCNTLTNREAGSDKEQFRVEQVVDRVSTLGTVWLGLTIGCARCHDHKYDQISQKEFYGLFAFYNTALETNIEAPVPGEMGTYLRRRPEYDRKRKELLAKYEVMQFQPDWEQRTLEGANEPNADPIWATEWKNLGLTVDDGQEILKLDPSLRTQKQKDKLTDYFIKSYGGIVGKERDKELKFKELAEKLAELKREYSPLSEAQALTENPNPPLTHILIRGDFRQPGVEVQPGTPAVLNPLPPDPKPSRLTLARWLVSKDNPLSARVAVNRMWQEFFGRGLVETSEDFGTRGDRPTHPELLDWLATEFRDNGWDMKRMHKLIVTSATYRQLSKVRKDLQTRDPNNKLLARQSRLRLPAELIRDEALAVSGLLNTAVGGKSVMPPLPPGAFDLAYASEVENWKESEGMDRYRRGLYTLFRRSLPYPQLIVFDTPDSLLACSRRRRSTIPLQALTLLNDPVFFEAAQAMAVRVLREKPGSLSDRIEYAYRLCLSRSPSPTEKNELLKYYQQQRGMLDDDPKAAETLFPLKSAEGVDPREAASWVNLSRVLLNLDEFITRE